MRKPELIAVACAALIVSGTALAQARGGGPPITPPGQEVGAPSTGDLARDLGIQRGQFEGSLAVK